MAVTEQTVFIPVGQSQRVSKPDEILLWKEATPPPPPPPAFVRDAAVQGEILKCPSVVIQGHSKALVRLNPAFSRDW